MLCHIQVPGKGRCVKSEEKWHVGWDYHSVTQITGIPYTEFFNVYFWRRAWQPTPVFLPGEPHGQRSLVGYGPLGRKELEATVATGHACIYQFGCTKP